MKKRLCLALILCPFIACAAETLKIDFRYNTVVDDGKNHVYWTQNGTKTKDAFDAKTGASKAKATKMLRDVQTENKVSVLPKGLYALLLFAVSPFAQSTTDNLQVRQDDTGMLTISFIHRGNAYSITSNEKGMLDVTTAFQIATELATNTAGVFSVKPEFLPESAEDTDATPVTDMSRIDWQKVTFVADTYDDKTETIWSGALKTSFVGGTLKITGTLKKIPKPEPPEEEHTDTEDTPPEEPKSAETEAENEDEAEPTGGVTGDVPPLEGVAEMRPNGAR